MGHLTIDTSQLLTLSVINKKPNVNVLCSFASRGLPILLQNNGTLVDLVQAIILNTVELCRNEILVPEDRWHEAISTHDFCLHGTFCVELLFCGATNWGSKSQR